MKQSDGYITVSSLPAHGTTFEIYFPRIDPAEEVTVTSSTVPQASRSSVSKTILLVDDNESVRAPIASLLEIKGYKVLQAESGSQALEMIQSRNCPVDLVITDVLMPRMSGLQLANHLKSIYPKIKVLYLSGYTQEAILDNGQIAAGSTFLSKPVPFEVLLAKIRELLSGDTG